MNEKWEFVSDDGVGAQRDRVRRFAVPGGYLYQVENNARFVAEGNHTDDSIITTDIGGWHAPVFVPVPEVSR